MMFNTSETVNSFKLVMVSFALNIMVFLTFSSTILFFFLRVYILHFKIVASKLTFTNEKTIEKNKLYLARETF